MGRLATWPSRIFTLIASRQRRLTGVDDMVISLSAKGLTHGEISAHLAEVYGAEVSKQTITAITDRVMEGLAEWQSRPLDAVYAVVFMGPNQCDSRVSNSAASPGPMVMSWPARISRRWPDST